MHIPLFSSGSSSSMYLGPLGWFWFGGTGENNNSLWLGLIDLLLACLVH